MRKTSVITGASRGIGYALTLALAKNGDHVFAVARNEADLLELQSHSLENITVVVADLTTESGRAKLLAAIGETKIDYLVNNAAIIIPLEPLQQYSEVEIRRIFETNIISHMILTNALIRNLVDGRILNITSVAAECAIPNLSGYCITKAAMNSWTAQLQLELAQYHIAVAGVIPGEVDTAMQGSLRDAPAESFPLSTEFQRAASEHTLISPHVVALFLKWLLKAVPEKDFQSTASWNIYDKWHRQQWIGSHQLPLPLNQEKLGNQRRVRKTLSEFAAILERNHEYFFAQDRHANALVLQGNLDLELLKKALEILYWNHPLLRSTIQFDTTDEQYYLEFHQNFSDIPFHHISSDQKNIWRSVLQRKLAEQFPVTHHLWEITVISEGDNRHIVLLHFHHAICDGTSTAHLQHQLMSVYEALKCNRDIYLPEDRIVQSPAELFQNPKNSKRVKKSVSEFRQLHPLPVGETFQVDAPIVSRTTHALLFGFSLDALKVQLAVQSQQDGVRYTINDLLVATFLLAKKRLQAGSQKETSLLTCVNLRKLFQNPLQAHHFDCLFDIVLTSHAVSESTTVWEMARLYQRQLKQTMDAILQRSVDFDCEAFRSPEEIEKTRGKKTYSGDLATSNIGMTSLQNRYADLTVEQFNFFTNQCAGFFGVLLDIATVGDTVFGNFTYAYPLQRHEYVQNLGKIYFEILQQCIPNFRLLPQHTDVALIGERSSVLSQLFLPVGDADKKQPDLTAQDQTALSGVSRA